MCKSDDHDAVWEARRALTFEKAREAYPEADGLDETNLARVASYHIVQDLAEDTGMRASEMAVGAMMYVISVLQEAEVDKCHALDKLSEMWDELLDIKKVVSDSHARRSH